MTAFFITAGSDRATVHHINIGLFAGAGKSVSVLTKKLLQCTGFVLVHFAAKGIKANAHAVSP
ncbi:hypothetical protein EVA_08556 [gut metagenome]|uniref:Uncharacterized protein n=1 Tax=gut metagenome TaxID=749906 RepID=J9GSS8_9ZZZZ